jgi:NAD(P)-dependent dehydrogenase (short-subunit alcohol dehydrogenase family)
LDVKNWREIVANMLNYQADPELLRHKTILITGAGDGIGKQAALTYSRYGARLILVGRTPNKLEELAATIQQETGISPLVHKLDLLSSDPAIYHHLAEQIGTAFGQLDGLLLNAGILGTLGPVEHISLMEWQQVQQVNVNSALLLIQALLPLMRLSPAASILFTSSGVGRQGRANWGSYAVSKFATEGLMQVLADELASTSIRVNAINPGATRTAMRASARPLEDPRDLKSPAELMPLYLYLMGADSQSIHGQSLDAQSPRNR